MATISEFPNANNRIPAETHRCEYEYRGPSFDPGAGYQCEKNSVGRCPECGADLCAEHSCRCDRCGQVVCDDFICGHSHQLECVTPMISGLVSYVYDFMERSEFIRNLEKRSMSTWSDEELRKYSALTGQAGEL